MLFLEILQNRHLGEADPTGQSKEEWNQGNALRFSRQTDRPAFSPSWKAQLVLNWCVRLSMLEGREIGEERGGATGCRGRRPE